VAGYALVGSADQVISAEKQIDDLKHFPSMKIEVVPQTGHAILWTHPQLIIEKILIGIVPLAI
jgi:pimeloyl-ACP methyl ester carboxylesterase